MPSPLFTPVSLGSLTLPNRIVMSGMTRSRAEEPGGLPGRLAALYYAQRASAGLIVTGSINISPEARGYLGTEGLFTAEQVARWREVTGAVHTAGGRIAAQLIHCGRVSHPSLQPGGAAPPGVSDIPADTRIFAYGPDGAPAMVSAGRPRRMDGTEITAAIASFGAAAAAAQRAGFDAVEIQGANGFIVEQFLHPEVNDRDDGYGGSVPGRTRFLLEAVQAVRDAAPGLPVGVKLSPNATINGLTSFEDWRAVHLHAIGQLTVDFLTVVGSAVDGAFLDEVRDVHRGALILNGGFDGACAAAAVTAGRADLVAFARAFLANPDLPARLRTGFPLAEADLTRLYGGGAEGYTDYPAMPATPADARTADARTADARTAGVGDV